MNDPVINFKAEGYKLGLSGADLSYRGVPQNYKMAFCNGYWEGRKAAPKIETWLCAKRRALCLVLRMRTMHMVVSARL